MRRVDASLAENILSEYESKNELTFPEKMEQDAMREQFVRGYLYAQKNEIDDLGIDDEEIRQQILQVRSKYCEPILKLLFQEGELYHGDLANKLDLSPSGLNAIIKKMMEGTTPIIEMMQIGKYKIYTLPDTVKKYMENKDQSKEVKKSERREDKENTEDLLLSLQHFVETADRDWKDELNLLLQGKDEGISDTVKKSFGELMEQVKKAEMYDRERFDELKRVIRNEVLIYLLDEYIREIKECDLIMAEIRQRENGKKLIRHFKMQ